MLTRWHSTSLVDGGAGPLRELLDAGPSSPTSTTDATAAAVDVELEWLLEPHAATSSAGASAKPIRLRIG